MNKTKHNNGDKVTRVGLFVKIPLKITNTMFTKKRKALHFCEYGRKGNGYWLGEEEIQKLK